MLEAWRDSAADYLLYSLQHQFRALPIQLRAQHTRQKAAQPIPILSLMERLVRNRHTLRSRPTVLLNIRIQSQKLLRLTLHQPILSRPIPSQPIPSQPTPSQPTPRQLTLLLLNQPIPLRLTPLLHRTPTLACLTLLDMLAIHARHGLICEGVVFQAVVCKGNHTGHATISTKVCLAIPVVVSTLSISA